MTDTVPHSGYSALGLFTGSRAQATDRLGGILFQVLKAGQLGHLATTFLDTTRNELANATFGLIDIDFAEVLTAGWRASESLKEAARATVAEPKDPELVQLAEHTITAAYHPKIEIVVNGFEAGSLDFELTLELKIEAVIGKVEAGRLVQLQIGKCTASGRLACADVRLASGELEMDPAAIIALGKGISLLSASERAEIEKNRASAGTEA